MSRVHVPVEIEDIVEEVPVSKMIIAYGPSNVLGCFTVSDILLRFDIDTILDAIGEERINDFLAYKNSKEIA